MTNSKPSVLLIDDNQSNLDSLTTNLKQLIQDVEIRTWHPTKKDVSLEKVFNNLVDDTTVLVVTDYDLSTGIKGLFGLTIVGWCQARSIPVGDFSKGKPDALPKEPNLFELRVPTDDEKGDKFIANAFHGFNGIRLMLEDNKYLLTEQRSLASVLASLLEHPRTETQFSAYMAKLGTVNSSLLQQLRNLASQDMKSEDHTKIQIRLLTYVLGHVLVNAILKYPGPILSDKGLCAYLATTTDELPAVEPLFEFARYTGPFSDGQALFWREEVDNVLDELGNAIADQDFESFGDYNRAVIQYKLGRELAKHSCNRCDGVKGGFWCPFTQRPVCERSDCSVTASSWIPSGAQLCRVEREFYDEWAPMLGL
jgi:hypothetical protein